MGYTFTYDTGVVPHLMSISAAEVPAENYSFTMLGNQSLSSPIDGSPRSPTTYLASVGLGTSHSFLYANGEMTQMTTPLGGRLRWQHRTFTFASSVSVREEPRRLGLRANGSDWAPLAADPASY